MKTARVLIVDDERNIRLTVTRALDQVGFQVEEAVNGEEAVEALRARRYDLVLLDLRLPGIDGMEVLRRMRRRGDRTKVVIVTAHGTVENAVEAMKLGAVDFIEKPFSPKELRELVARAVERRERLLLRPGTEARTEQAEPEGRYEECLRQAKSAVELMAFEEAQQWARRAVAADTARPEAYNLLGALLEIRDDRLEAQKFYRAALSLDPTFEPAQRNLERTTSFNSHGVIDLGERQGRRERRR